MRSSTSIRPSVSTLSSDRLAAARCPWTSECEWVVPVTHEGLTVKVISQAAAVGPTSVESSFFSS